MLHTYIHTDVVYLATASEHGCSYTKSPPYMYIFPHSVLLGRDLGGCATPETKRGYPFRQNQVRVHEIL